MIKKSAIKKDRSANKKTQLYSKQKKDGPLPRKFLLLKTFFTLIALVSVYIIYLDAVITKQFEGKKWAVPAKVFAHSVELRVGKLITPTALHSQLKSQGYQAVQKVGRPGTFSKSDNEFIIYSRGFHFPDGAQPPRYAKVSFGGNQIIRLVDKNNKNISLLKLDPQPIGGIYPTSYQDRLLIRSAQTPYYLIPSLLIIEDREYYDHFGISLRSLIRAIIANFKSGAIVQGGSTITQQLVKNFFLNNERTIIRKGKEAVMALLLEYHYSKEEILETYLNEVYLGQHDRRAIHGFGLASQFYFAQPIHELDLAKTALLVALVKGPSWYNPRRYPERVMKRRNHILDVLAEKSIISAAEAQRSKKLPLGVVSQDRLRTNDFPAYIDIVKEQLRKDYDEDDLTSEGLRIFTNLDPIIQREAQKSVTKNLNLFEKKLQGAMIVTSVQMGELLAVVGDRNPGYAGFNRATEAHRPVGSLLKPAIYLTALENPRKYTLTTPVKDTPVRINDGQGGYWRPQNYNRVSHGLVPLYVALAQSYNQAAANTGMDVGLPSVLDTLKRLGVDHDLPSYPSLLLGSLSMSPIEVATMYQTIASGGYRISLRAIDTVVNSEGIPLKSYSTSVERTFDPEPIELLRTALSIAMKEGTGRRVYQSVEPGILLAGKTGTTNDNRDSWFAGFSGNLMAVTWVGHDDNTPTKLTGSSGALKIWASFMSAIPIQSVTPLVSKNITNIWVNPITNSQSRQYCKDTIQLPYIRGSEPRNYTECGSGKRKSLFNNIKR